MKRTSRILPALGIGALVALGFVAIQRDWIIIQWPHWGTVEQTSPHIAHKQTVQLFWYQDRWVQEPVEIIASHTDTAQTIQHLVERWLSWLDEERHIDRKVSLQSAMLTPNGQEVMLSFDRTPFGTESTVREKLAWVESLLKTMRDNGVKAQQVRFLVHHQELQDYHLDFSFAWPVIGYMQSR